MSRFAVHDPDRRFLHRAIRTTLVLTAVYALGVVVLDDTSIGLFGSFGAFALLAVADFGGSPAGRIRAYVELVAVGAVLIALATVVSEQTAVAAVVLATVAFVATLVGVLGGTFAAGAPAALLMFVVAVMVPAPASAVGGREIGWLVAGAASTVVASVLWPVHQRREIRLAAAAVADTVAGLTRRGTPADEHEAASLRSEVTRLRDRYGASTLRPAGPTRHDQAMVRLLDELLRSTSFATELRSSTRWPDPGPLGAGTDRPDLDGPDLEAADVEAADVDDPALAAAVADTFEHAALVLRGTVAPSPSAALEPIRDRHRAALELWVARSLRAGHDAEVIAAQLAHTFSIRVLSLVASSCEGDAVVACGGRVDDDGDELVLGASVGAATVASTAARTGALLRPHLRPGSVAFRNALRASVALSAALVVADLIHAEHGFWVVLGTLTVLKSSAMRTGITAFEALLGNVVGFAVAAVAMVVLGDSRPALWCLLPVAVFLTVYAPGAIHFVVGQAAFTVFVVTLFNIIDPQGWRTGLVRVESIAIGVAVSLVVGVVFWPRGNRTALRGAVVGSYRAVAAYLDAALAALVAPAPAGADAPVPAVRATRSAARAAELTADSALFELLASPTYAGTPVAPWARLTSVARSLRLVGDGVSSIPLRGFAPVRGGPEVRELGELRDRRVAEVIEVATRVGVGGPRRAVPGDAPPLARWLARVDPDDATSVDRAVALVWAAEWIRLVDALVEVDEEPITQVGATVAAPWWR